MPVMTAAAASAFLDEPGHLVRLATVDADGMPRVVPIWFIHRGGEIFFTPRGPSVFLANIRRDPRVGLSVDEEPLPYRKVTVQGTARIVHDLGDDDVWRDLYREIACRYIDKERADAYVGATIDQPRALLAVALAGAKVTTWVMPDADEDQTGIWHRRYYLDGTLMANLADGVPSP
jgi:PPOX class probable F420-dependent enzyme